MNVGSYHQQHQQLLQFNIHQHQPSLPLGSNEADNKVNNRSDPMYNQEAPSMMGTPGHPGMPSMPPSMDQITRNVNKMSFQDNPAHNHASFPPQTMDQNKNMTPNDGLNGANNYGDFPSNSVRKMPPPSNSMPASISNNYHWNQGANTNSYPNNNAAINNSPRSHDPNEGHTMQDQRAAPQQHNFSVPPQNKPATPALASQTNNFLPPQNKPAPPASAPQTNNFPLPSQNKSFPPAGASVSQTNNFPLPPQSSSVPPNNLPLSQNSSLSSAPPSSTPPSNNYALPPQNKSFPAASSGQQMNDFASPTQNKSFSPSPAVSQQDFISPSQNKPFPPVSQNNSYPAPQNSYPGQPQTFVSQNGSFPPSTQGSFSAPKPQGTFPPSVSGSYPTPRVNSPQHSFPPQGASYQNPSYPAASQPYPAAPSSAYPLSTPSSAYPPSATYRQPPKSQMYPSANPPPSSFSQYNQKSAFSPPPSRSAPGNLDQGNMMPQQPMGPPTHGYGDYQQQPQHKLDPDQMPNPIQVMIEDREVHKSETFITNQPGLMPPLVTTNFIVEDEGNANPRFIRSTMYNIPVNTDMMKQADVPFSLVITPLATLPAEEQLPPIVNTAEFGPVRCVRCKAYVNPYMKFVDGGRRFVCALCKAVTEVPAEYFQHLDHTGNRVDRYERPELLYGAYEFTVTKEYCKDNEIPNVPAIIFVIDVSYNNVKSGMVKILCEQMSDIVQNYMPTDDHDENAPRMRVGFITYDSTVHFYNIKACLGQPQMMIVGDMDDVFVPLVEGFLCDPVESSSVIESLMEQIPVTFAETRETDTVLLPAIKAGVEALKAAKCAGKLLVFHSSLPTANVPGKLVNREDRKLLGTDKEKVQLSPQNSAYSSLAEECVNVGCSVDLFVFNNAPIDLPTIGQISKLTGGEIYKYTYFQAEIDGERLIEDVKRDTSRNIAFDAVMRVRTSTGIRPVNFFGHIFMKNTTDLELASINADKSVAVEIKHDDKLVEEEGAFVQVALLYTSCGGQRRVRILNLALKCCSQISDVFRSCELDTIINYLSKAAVTKIVEGTPRQVKEGLVNKCAHILACYRRLCASPSSPGQLILPECMKLLPLYMNCLLKSDAISGGSDMTVDDRWYMMQYVMIMDIPSSVNYFYPRLMPLVNIDYYSHELPFPIRCSSYKLTHSEAYLLENGVYMFLWLGSQVPAEWLMNVFGVVDPSLVALNVAKIPVLDNVHSKKINSIINQIQRERRHTMKLTIVRENDKMEIVFKHFLVEDGTGGAVMADNLSSSSYVDFLCHMHKEIRNMLS